MDEREKLFIDSLSKKDKSDADIVSSIDALEVLLSIEALPVLVRLMTDLERPFSVRERAAKAIKQIGSNCVRDELISLSKSNSKELNDLTQIAL